MGFKQNLMQKMEIDTLALAIKQSWGPPGSGGRVDKQQLRRLLQRGPFEQRQERDLEIYLIEGSFADGKILVLDNEVAIYQTNATDVVLRKSPTVKEMISIRNIIKILNDTDVVVSKKEASVDFLQRVCIGALDLSYNTEDIAHLRREGVVSLETADATGVMECLTLFKEILAYAWAGRPFAVPETTIMGTLTAKGGGQHLFGPFVCYRRQTNQLVAEENRYESVDDDQLASYRRIVAGQDAATHEGPAALQFLQNQVLERKPKLGQR
jgi:hypothetical protein